MRRLAIEEPRGEPKRAFEKAADTWVRLHLLLLVAYGGIEVDRPYVVGRARGECAGGERPLRCGASARYSIEVGYRDAIEGQERSYRGAREEL